MNFTGKTVLVTGAAVGIGRATAIKFAQNGANLVLLDINYEKLESVKKEIEEFTDKVLIFKCDVSDVENVNSVVAEAEKTFGKIDILVNNAALWRDRGTFLETPAELWQKYIDINIMGVVHCTKAVLPKMIENNYGRIINVASVAGIYGNIHMAHYSATKSAVIAMTKSLAKEVINNGIIVNSVSPGSVSPADNPDMNFYKETKLSHTGRTGTDMENANLICFLASDDATYIIGQNIQIDGCRKLI